MGWVCQLLDTEVCNRVKVDEPAVAMDASAFYDQNLTFRGIPDDLASLHLEGSECCLIHADNPLSHSKGVFLNPNVRVGSRTMRL